jgi:hypothetical protein
LRPVMEGKNREVILRNGGRMKSSWHARCGEFSW